MTMKLLLALENPYHCLDTSECGHVFNESGGAIGSNLNSAWVLQGRQKPFPDIACIILVYQGKFCIKMVEGDLYINNNCEPINPGMVIALNDADRLQLNEYKMSACFLGDDMQIHWLSPISDILGTQKNVLLTAEPELPKKSGRKKAQLLTLENFYEELDPLKALTKKTKATDTDLVDEFRLNSEKDRVDPVSDKFRTPDIRVKTN